MKKILYNCYLCDYCVDMLNGEELKKCKYCPLDWESEGDKYGLYQCLASYEEVGLYRKAKGAVVWEEQYKLCKKIANLKEV